MLSKIFDVQNKRFTTVTCDRCTYTEIYRIKSSALGHVLDFFTQLARRIARSFDCVSLISKMLTGMP